MKKPVRVEQENHLGDFVMRTSATGIESVEVKARLVRREADRFVVDVANAPAAIGKDGIELLERAPGVWIDGEKISINGKSGSKVYVNDRELRMEPEQLLTYLRSLRAEEIQKIEVVPTSGADYDADSAGGIIRITLKKRRENGVNGSVAFNTTQGEIVHRYNPSANINLHSGRVDFYASAWGSFGKDETTTGEQTRYEAADKELNAHSSMKGRNRSLRASAGAVVEIDNRNSVGAEFEYWRNRNGEPNDTYTDFRNAGTVTRTDSHFDKLDIRNNYSATFNYIRKIDTLGSTLKLLADYTRRETDSGNDNFSRMTAPGATADSTYRDNTESVYNIATATLALEKRFSPRWTLKAGAKYTYNDMHNDALYEYLKGDAWTRNDNQSFTIDYTENIAAAYAVASAQLGRWGLVAGLRGEYTHDGKKRRTGLFLALSKRQRLLRPFEGERMVADRPIRPDHRTAALLVPQPPADADFGLHLPDGKPVARPGVQAGREPHAGGRPQIHPHGRRAARQRRDSADDTGRPGESRPACNWHGSTTTAPKTITSRSICLSSPRNGGN